MLQASEYPAEIGDFFVVCVGGQFSKYKPPGGLYLEWRFNGGFFALFNWEAYIWSGLFSEFYGILESYLATLKQI